MLKFNMIINVNEVKKLINISCGCECKYDSKTCN